MNILIRSMSSRAMRSEEHKSELQSLTNLVCRLLLEKKKSPPPPAIVPRWAVPRSVRLRAAVYKRQHTIDWRTGAMASVEVRGDLDEFFFFFNDTATTEIYTLSLHDAVPICSKLTSEYRLLATDDPEGLPRLVAPRRE